MNTQIRHPILTLRGLRQNAPPCDTRDSCDNALNQPEIAPTPSATPAPKPPVAGVPAPAPKSPTRNLELDEAFDDLRALRKRFKGMRRPLPLKIGVAADLIAETGWPADRIGRALGIHVNATSYLRATVEGAPRVDLNGTAVGTITADQAAYAKSVLRAREKKKGQA